MKVVRALLAISWMGLFTACGSRTELLIPAGTVDGPDSGAANSRFGNDDGGTSSPHDALPPIHVTPRPVPNNCPDPSTTLVYVITASGELLSFDPRGSTFTSIGVITCPSTSRPNSMAVDRLGTAYVNFWDGSLFRVSTRTAVCQRTAFVPGQQGFAWSYGMGFAADASGTGETLYVAEARSATPERLAWIDTTSFALHLVGAFVPTIFDAELTGTGSGDLFAFSGGVGSFIAQIDKAIARLTGQSLLRGVSQGSSYAFAFWGGDFYTFTSPSVGSVVTRFRPSDGSILQVAQYAEPIVGAGVSTCAPQQ